MVSQEGMVLLELQIQEMVVSEEGLQQAAIVILMEDQAVQE